MSSGDAVVYCLATVELPIYTYIGATMDKDRRLKQHNGILKGGAKATHKRPNGWYRVCYVQGFPSWEVALSFEWHWKHFSSTKKISGTPLERRRLGLDKCIAWAAEKGLEGLEIIYE
jgi:structure-specific endonuclease subunit SLX1